MKLWKQALVTGLTSLFIAGVTTYVMAGYRLGQLEGLMKAMYDDIQLIKQTLLGG